MVLWMLFLPIDLQIMRLTLLHQARTQHQVQVLDGSPTYHDLRRTQLGGAVGDPSAHFLLFLQDLKIFQACCLDSGQSDWCSMGKRITLIPNHLMEVMKTLVRPGHQDLV